MTSLRTPARRDAPTSLTFACQSDNVLDADVTQHGDTEDCDSPRDAVQRRKKLTRRRHQKTDVTSGNVVNRSKSFEERGVSVDGDSTVLSACHVITQQQNDLDVNSDADERRAPQTIKCEATNPVLQTPTADTQQHHSPSKQVNFSQFPQYKNFDCDMGDQVLAKEGEMC